MPATLLEPTIMPTTPPRPEVVEVPVWHGVLRSIQPDQQALLTGLAWDDYEAAMAERERNAREKLRIVFDRGNLAVMPTSRMHEIWKWYLSILIEHYALFSVTNIQSSGSFTIRREDLERGFEPDECYYIQNAARMLPLRELDLWTDPPPDLAIEVEMGRSVLPKLPLLAAFHVPEVWRFDGELLTCLLLDEQGEYTPSPQSRAFPKLDMANLTRHLLLAPTLTSLELHRQFRSSLSEKS